MRISELEAREDFSTILRTTLADGWSTTLGRPVEVSVRGRVSGQDWFVNPVFSAIHTRGVDPEVRHFLADSLKFTPKRARLPAQFLLGVGAATRAGLALLARPIFTVSPELPGASRILVVPGNQRVRIFDFGTHRTRVFLKTGFDRGCMQREIELRANAHPDAPFPKILVSDGTGTWFEEALLDGWSLPRCPPWLDKRGYEEEAFRILELWLDRTGVETSADEYVAGLLTALREGLQAEAGISDQERHSLVADLERVASVAATLRVLKVARSHGDFQPGNVFVESATRTVKLIDWEYCGVRSVFYDRLSYCLGARFQGWVERFEGYAKGDRSSRQSPAPLREFVPWDLKKAILALFALEELHWRLQAAGYLPFPGPRRAWVTLLRENSARILRAVTAARGKGTVS